MISENTTSYLVEKESLKKKSAGLITQISGLVFQNLLARVRYISSLPLEDLMIPSSPEFSKSAHRHSLSQTVRKTSDNFSTYLVIHKHSGLEFDITRSFCFSNMKKVPFEGQLHSHDYIEIFYIISGTFSQMLLGEIYTFQAGDIVVTDKNCEHADIYDSEDASILFLWISTSYMEKLLKYNNNQGEFQRFLFHAISQKKREQSFLIFQQSEKQSQDNQVRNYDVSILLERLVQEEYLHAPGCESVIEGLLIRFFYILGKNYTLIRHTDERSTKEKLILFELEKYIRENYMSVNAQILEEHFHYHRNYYNKILQKYRGVSLTEYTKNIRIQMACELLTNTSLTIKDISYAIGYENTTYFYKLFEKKMGMKPKDYRKHFLSVQ